MDPNLPAAESVLTFWFEEAQPKQWFVRDENFDALIRQRFGALHQAAERCELFAWRTTPAGRLAEVIVLDQFSRNLYRGEARVDGGGNRIFEDAGVVVLTETAV